MNACILLIYCTCRFVVVSYSCARVKYVPYDHVMPSNDVWTVSAGSAPKTKIINAPTWLAQAPTVTWSKSIPSTPLRSHTNIQRLNFDLGKNISKIIHYFQTTPIQLQQQQQQHHTTSYNKHSFNGAQSHWKMLLQSWPSPWPWVFSPTPWASASPSPRHRRWAPKRRQHPWGAGGVWNLRKVKVGWGLGFEVISL